MVENEMDDVPLFIGGIIPNDDVPALLEMGVTGVFGPGTSTEEIINSIRTAALEGPHADPLGLADAESQ
jgi:methylmalonyl-CoA mutase C-terminal domain/subunit